MSQSKSELDLEKARSTLKEALALFDAGGWTECSPNEIIEMRFAHLLAAERASLPESVIKEFEFLLENGTKEHPYSCNWDSTVPKCLCGEDAMWERAEKALAELKAWQEGK